MLVAEVALEGRRCRRVRAGGAERRCGEIHVVLHQALKGRSSLVDLAGVRGVGGGKAVDQGEHGRVQLAAIIEPSRTLSLNSDNDKLARGIPAWSGGDS